jgi:hypothetical protein
MGYGKEDQNEYKNEISSAIKSTGDGSHLSLLGDFYDNAIAGTAWEYTVDRKLYLYQDGQLVAKMTIPADFPLIEGGGHPGLYGLSANGAHIPPFQTGTLYNDNWSMVVWP